MQGYISCMGLISLERRFTRYVLEMACEEEFLFAQETQCSPVLSRIKCRCEHAVNRMHGPDENLEDQLDSGTQIGENLQLD